MNNSYPDKLSLEEKRAYLRAGNGRRLAEIMESGSQILENRFQGVSDWNSALFDVFVHHVVSNGDFNRVLATLAELTKDNIIPEFSINTVFENQRIATGFVSCYRELEKNGDPALSQSQKVLLPINNTDLEELVGKSLQAVCEQNSKEPSIFVRSGELIRILSDELGRPRVSKIDEKAMLGILCRSVKYVRVSASGDFRNVDPPINVIKTILGMGSWEDIPILKGITQTPILHKDGSIHLDPGYDSLTGYYYEPGNMGSIPEIPENPTPEQVKEAVSVFLEPFSEFPYEDSGSYASVLAAVLSVMGRNLIKGPIPLLIISKPQMGTGASKLCEIIASITTGRPMNILPQPESEAEWRKSIFAKLQDSPQLVVLDNYEHMISSPTFASLLTAQEWSDRLLCQSKIGVVSNKSVWIANGNNLKIGKDFPRRVFLCRLDAQEPNPWEREDFIHPDLVDWVSENRAIIVGSILLLLRSYLKSGAPAWKRSEQVKIMGGFEAWGEFLGGVLDHIGISGFLENQEKMYESIDSDTADWDAFFNTWYKIYNDDPVSVSDICIMLDREKTDRESEGSLVSVLPDCVGDVPLKTQSFKTKLGVGIARNENRIFSSGVMVKKVGIRQGATKWQVVRSNHQTRIYRDESCSSPVSGNPLVSSRNHNHLIMKNSMSPHRSGEPVDRRPT